MLFINKTHILEFLDYLRLIRLMYTNIYISKISNYDDIV